MSGAPTYYNPYGPYGYSSQAGCCSDQSTLDPHSHGFLMPYTSSLAPYQTDEVRYIVQDGIRKIARSLVDNNVDTPTIGAVATPPTWEITSFEDFMNAFLKFQSSVNAEPPLVVEVADLPTAPPVTAYVDSAGTALTKDHTVVFLTASIGNLPRGMYYWTGNAWEYQ